jgi:hypothetical protein
VIALASRRSQRSPGARERAEWVAELVQTAGRAEAIRRLRKNVVQATWC